MPLKREALLWSIVGLVLATVSVVYLLERPTELNPVSVFVLVETTVTIVGLIYLGFVTVAWHWPIFRGWLVRVPDLRGTWVGYVTPIVADGATPAIPAKLLIRQSLFSVTCTMYTANMKSQSFTGSAFLDEATNETRLVYSYSSDPNLSQRERNPRHDGTAVFELDPDEERVLKGRYFTDRCTRGEMRFKFQSKKIDARPITAALIFAFATIILGSARAAASTPQCSVIDGYAPQVQATFASASPVTLQMNILSADSKLVARQLQFGAKGDARLPLVLREAIFGKDVKLAVRCSFASDAKIDMLTVVDVGPQVVVNALYLGQGAAAVSFYAYQEDYFAGRKDEGLTSQLFSVQLDGRPPYQIAVTAKPGEDVTLRFDRIAAGKHRISFCEMEPDGYGDYSLTKLQSLEFTQPTALAMAIRNR